IVEGARIGKQAAYTGVALGAGGRVAQPAEDQGEIGAVAGHALEEVLCQGQIVRPRSEQAELAAEARGICRLEAGGERVDCLLRLFDGSVLVLCKQRQERLRQTGEVPLGDAWLVAVSVAPHVVDGAVDRPWVIDVHEGAGAVVDGLARYRHVVGVHGSMNEADEHPLRYKRCLARDHQVEEGAVPVRGVNRLWVMPRDDVISEAPDRIQIPTRREELEGADTDVARRDAGQYRARQRRFAPNRLTGRHSGERSGRRNSASSIGPPMRKKRTSVPSFFNDFARISEPV